MSDASKRKEKQKWAIDKPKLDIAARLRGIFFIEHDDEEFKRTMKIASRKLEIPMPAAMPCKTPINGRGETCRSMGKHKTEYACIVEADESVRIRWEGVPFRYHEDHKAVKGTNSLSHYNLVARGMGPKACQRQAAAGPRGSRTCVCANTSGGGWHMQGRKGELTSCRDTV